jgi:hypothetical protein
MFDMDAEVAPPCMTGHLPVLFMVILLSRDRSTWVEKTIHIEQATREKP